MKKRQRIKTKVGLGLLLAAALALGMVPALAMAQGDMDSDGFTDQEEITAQPAIQAIAQHKVISRRKTNVISRNIG